MARLRAVHESGAATRASSARQSARRPASRAKVAQAASLAPAAGLSAMATTLGSSARVAQLARIGEALDRSSRASAQREVAQAMGARGSGAGSQPLPDTLASGIEQLSGMSMDGVRVHHGSSKPAQLNALAYTQGDDIYVGRGQEAHVPHEAWHVVQQRQGRVQPTTQIGDVEVNDQPHLEREATVMGDRAAREAS